MLTSRADDATGRLASAAVANLLAHKRRQAAAAMSRVLLAVNAGSSTLKFRAFAPDGRQLLARGMVDRFSQAKPELQLLDGKGQMLSCRALDDGGRANAIAAVINSLADQQLEPVAVVHRVVHGGGRFTAATRLNVDIRVQLEEYVALAPLHQPVSLAVISAFEEYDARPPQFACFDTAFHAQQPEVATRFGIARHWHDEGVRRYGFHGLSYAAIARRSPELGLERAKVVVCHLGSGQRLRAGCRPQHGLQHGLLRGGRADDGRRPGYIDPEVILYWQEQAGMSVAEVRRELYKNSGLLGVSGISSDMRELLASDLPAARGAVELFCYRVARNGQPGRGDERP